MARVIIYIFFFLIFIGTTPVLAYAEGVNPEGPNAGSSNAARSSVAGSSSAGAASENLTDQVDLSDMESLLKQIDADVQKSLPDFSLSKMFNDLKQGKLSLDPNELGRSLLVFLRNEIVKGAPLIGELLLLAVICVVLKQLHNAFDGDIGKISQMLTYLVLLTLALASIKVVLDEAQGAIDQMVGLMQTFYPVMLTLLVAMGNITTAALLKPVIMGSLAFLGTLLKTIVLPLFFLAAVLKMFNHISDQFKLTKLAELLEFAGKVSLGLVLTLFIGVMTIEGVTGGVADGVVLRTAKYSADLIPVVGKYFKDAVELVMTSGILLKNALGIVSILALALICLGPLLRILAVLLIFKISAALIEPLGEHSLADTLQSMSASLVYMFVVVASVAVMFFITVAIVVGAGNLSVMLR